MAHIIVIGAGVIGCASAWALTRAGHQVTIVDKNPSVCGGASARNGAQLSYAYGDALASPGLLRHLPAILMRRDPAYRVWLAPDPEFLVWGLRFLRNATASRFRGNTTALLALAARTQALLPDVVETHGLKFDYAASGKMILYPDAAAFAKARHGHALKTSLGIRQDLLTRDEATRLEPALAHYRDAIEGVVWSPDDAAGRPTAFCKGLVDGLEREGGLVTLFGKEVQKLIVTRGRVAGVEFRDHSPLEADAVVLATGHSSGSLRMPWSSIWPVQGYSVTVPATDGAMRASITDLKRKIVFARLGDQIRIAGNADIGPRPIAFRAKRFDALTADARAAFSTGFDLSGELDAWSEARPCTPSSQPIIRASGPAGLFLNLGHGTLGWTLSLGAAERLVEVMRASIR